MSDQTTTYSIDNSKDWPVTAQTPCRRIVVQENYNSATPPTADLLQKQPVAAATAINIAKGTPAIFTPVAHGPRLFNAGQIVGSIRTVSGSVTVSQQEGEAV